MPSPIYILYSNSFENVTFFAIFFRKNYHISKVCEFLRKFANFCENLRIKKLSNLPIFQLLRPNFDKKFGFSQNHMDILIFNIKYRSFFRPLLYLKNGKRTIQ
jgi:hypothetical protein